MKPQLKSIITKTKSWRLRRSTKAKCIIYKSHCGCHNHSWTVVQLISAKIGGSGTLISHMNLKKHHIITVNRLNLAHFLLIKRINYRKFSLQSTTTFRNSQINFKLNSKVYCLSVVVIDRFHMSRRPCLCTKKNPVGIELFSQVKNFFYSKQFAKLLTT